MTGADIRAAEEARVRLGLTRGAGDGDLRAAFQRAVKATHPDRGGDPEQFRQVLDAYRFLKARAELGSVAQQRPVAKPAPRAQPRPQPAAAAPKPEAAKTLLRISVTEAFLGGAKSVRLPDGKRGKIKLPPGLRSGEAVRFGPDKQYALPVLIVSEPGAEVRGDDLWLTVGVSQTFLKDGGRLEVSTPFGRRKLWISRSSAARGLFRAPGEGLPAVGARPRGHLYLKLELDQSLADTPAKSLLKRFAASWAA